MNRDEKAAVIDEVAERIKSSPAIFAIDYRGLSVKQAVDLRAQLAAAGARFQVVKNRLTIRAADQAGAEQLKELLDGPTALTFVDGDAAVAAKALATFRRQAGVLEFKGGTMDGETLTADQIESIARLPARDVLHGQFVGVLASPLTGLVRGLASMIGGLASQLQQMHDQGLVSGAPPEAEGPAAAEAAEPDAAEAAEPEAPEAPEAAPEPEAAEAAEETATPSDEAPGDPAAEAETAEQETSDAPEESGDAGEAAEPPSGETQEQEG
ncbi:MAG TPA: 50S ribosomal protein L10 [Thermoleophilaceae bacterium]